MSIPFQEETTTEAVQESKGGRKAWQSSRKRIPKRLRDFGNNDADGRKTTGQKEEGKSDDKDREVNNFDNAVAQEGFVVSKATPETELINKAKDKARSRTNGRQSWAEHNRKEGRLENRDVGPRSERLTQAAKNVESFFNERDREDFVDEEETIDKRKVTVYKAPIGRKAWLTERRRKE